MKNFPWRIVLYLVFILYLLIDLKWCGGPLRQAYQSRRDVTIKAAIENRWVAIVNLEPITGGQLDLATFRHLYQRGKHGDEIPEKNLQMIRRAVLQQLINETLVRHYADGENFTAPTEEIERYITSWKSQFATEDEMAGRLEAQGLTEAELDEELTRVWSRKRWLEKRILPAVKVTDEEVRAWFDANHEGDEDFIEPVKVHARQIFLSTVEVEDDSKETLIRDLHARLTVEDADFSELAKQYSEDERSKKRGGDINWLAADRLPDEFTKPVFQLKKGELSPPFQTKIGWYIVEILDRQEERPQTFDEVAEEIQDHLESERTIETIKVLMKKYRTIANIQLFPEHI
ncbi:peptidylprolyl isomerase [Verrucomicrobiales bacterium]|nr:peptidylprolyl isomerase [Verrucomicrobiales bacterium]